MNQSFCAGITGLPLVTQIQGRTKLPPNFWSRIIKLEKEINNKKIELDNVQELISLYRKAVEYFDDSNEMAQFKYYKQKINDLHTRPDVIQCTLNPPNTKIARSQSVADLKFQVKLLPEIPSAQERRKNLEVAITEKDVRNYIDTEVQEHERSMMVMEKSMIIIEDELLKQKEKTIKRLKDRQSKQLKLRFNEKESSVSSKCTPRVIEEEEIEYEEKPSILDKFIIIITQDLKDELIQEMEKCIERGNDSESEEIRRHWDNKIKDEIEKYKVKLYQRKDDIYKTYKNDILNNIQ